MEKEKNIILMVDWNLKANKKRNGKGKEYNNNGKLEFEGDYLKGKRNGEGKEYNNNDKLKFEGKLLLWRYIKIWRRIFKRRKKWERKRI